jgi:hypothetical protein
MVSEQFFCYVSIQLCISLRFGDIHTYRLSFISEGVAQVTQIVLRDAYILPNNLAMRNTADMTGGKPIAVWSHSNLDVSAVNSLVAFYDINGRKGEVIFFSSLAPHKTIIIGDIDGLCLFLFKQLGTTYFSFNFSLIE